MWWIVTLPSPLLGGESLCGFIHPFESFVTVSLLHCALLMEATEMVDL